MNPDPVPVNTPCLYGRFTVTNFFGDKQSESVQESMAERREQDLNSPKSYEDVEKGVVTQFCFYWPRDIPKNEKDIKDYEDLDIYVKLQVSEIRSADPSKDLGKIGVCGLRVQHLIRDKFIIQDFHSGRYARNPDYVYMELYNKKTRTENYVYIDDIADFVNMLKENHLSRDNAIKMAIEEKEHIDSLLQEERDVNDPRSNYISQCKEHIMDAKELLRKTEYMEMEAKPVDMEGKSINNSKRYLYDYLVKNGKEYEWIAEGKPATLSMKEGMVTFTGGDQPKYFTLKTFDGEELKPWCGALVKLFEQAGQVYTYISGKIFKSLKETGEDYILSNVDYRNMQFFEVNRCNVPTGKNCLPAISAYGSEEAVREAKEKLKSSKIIDPDDNPNSTDTENEEDSEEDADVESDNPAEPPSNETVEDEATASDKGDEVEHNGEATGSDKGDEVEHNDEATGSDESEDTEHNHEATGSDTVEEAENPKEDVTKQAEGQQDTENVAEQPKGSEEGRDVEEVEEEAREADEDGETFGRGHFSQEDRDATDQEERFKTFHWYRWNCKKQVWEAGCGDFAVEGNEIGAIIESVLGVEESEKIKKHAIKRMKQSKSFQKIWNKENPNNPKTLLITFNLFQKIQKKTDDVFMVQIGSGMRFKGSKKYKSRSEFTVMREWVEDELSEEFLNELPLFEWTTIPPGQKVCVCG